MKMELNTKRNRIILVSVVLAIVLIVTILATSSTKSCSLMSEVPEPANIRPRKSTSDLALVTFSGYLNYFDQSKNSTGYMPLELQSVGFISTKYDEVKRLNLDAKCAKIEFALYQEFSSPINEVFEIRVDLVEANGQVKSCIIDKQQFEISATSKIHYACYSMRSYNCYSWDTTAEERNLVAKLIVLGFEFEIDGNRQVIRQESFSTPAKYCDRYA